jgi:hypothetical protein
LGEVDQRLDLKHFRNTGHWVRDARLASTPVFVVFTPYVQRRMQEREIDEFEVLQVLALPRAQHCPDKEEGRYEVEGTAERGPLCVIYERPAVDIVLIVTTFADLD